MEKTEFDLKKALNGHAVVTRDGRRVTDIRFEKHSRVFSIYGAIDDLNGYWTIDGFHSGLGVRSNLDIFLAIPERGDLIFDKERKKYGTAVAYDDGLVLYEEVDSVPFSTDSFDVIADRGRPIFTKEQEEWILNNIDEHIKLGEDEGVFHEKKREEIDIEEWIYKDIDKFYKERIEQKLDWIIKKLK